jgi:hypothetical protein
LELQPKIFVDNHNARLISVHRISLDPRVWNAPRKSPLSFTHSLERQMSKRKLATASKGARHSKMATRAQRNKQAIVRSQKDSFLRSVAPLSVEPPARLHEDSRQEASVVENGLGASQDDLNHKIGKSDPVKGVALGIANLPALQQKLLEIAQANVQFGFEFALRLATIRSPTEVFAVAAEFTSRRIGMFGQQSKEMSAYPFLRTDVSREVKALTGR